jgi:hypothetical protein
MNTIYAVSPIKEQPIMSAGVNGIGFCDVVIEEF